MIHVRQGGGEACIKHKHYREREVEENSNLIGTRQAAKQSSSTIK